MRKSKKKNRFFFYFRSIGYINRQNTYKIFIFFIKYHCILKRNNAKDDLIMPCPAVTFGIPRVMGAIMLDVGTESAEL